MNFNLLPMFTPFGRNDEDIYKEQLKTNADSITAPKLDDGAREVESMEGDSFATGQSGLMQQMFGGQDPVLDSTRKLIDTYRSLMNNYEVDNAVQEIVTDSICYEDGHDVVALSLEDADFSESIKNKMIDEFKEVLNALRFQRKGSDHFRRWYVDSRIFFHKIIDVKKPKNGIIELRRLDPRQVEFVREVVTEMQNGVKVVKGYKEFFIYDTGNESYYADGRVYNAGTKVKIPRSAITYAHSGLVDCSGKSIIGYLHRAVKPANQLKLLEDAMVIYRITRAPDRRAFYIDTGNMPSRKAQQHMQHIMNTFKNRVVYDSSTGKIKNQQHNMSMTEDYWLQRRDGKAVTEIEQLPGATGMNEMDDVRWFRNALYMALRIPLTRIPNDQGGVQFDAGTAITRDEVKFGEFIRDLQHKFEEIFLDPLKTNLILKKIITEADWERNINNIKITFHRNSYFTEMKDAEIEERRINMMVMAEPIIGKYISHQTAAMRFLQMSEEEIKEEAKLIEEESKIERFKTDEEPEDF